MKLYTLLRARPPEVLAAAFTKEDLDPAVAQDKTAHPNATYEVSEHEVKRGDPKKQLAVRRRVLICIYKNPGITLVKLRESVVGRNEDIATALRSLQQCEYITRARGFEITEAGKKYLNRPQTRMPEEHGQKATRIESLLRDRGPMTARQLAIAVYGEYSSARRNQAASLAHYLVYQDRATVENARFAYLP